MVTQRTLQRKLQKKAKRKGWFACPQCGDRPFRYISNGDILATKQCRCGWRGLLDWPGVQAPRRRVYPGKYQ